VTCAVVFRRSDPVSARLHGGPFQTRDPVGPEEDLEEITSEQMVSLALAQDLPLFLLQGRLVSD
jgi:hypothetical protein